MALYDSKDALDRFWLLSSLLSALFVLALMLQEYKSLSGKAQDIYQACAFTSLIVCVPLGVLWKFTCWRSQQPLRAHLALAGVGFVVAYFLFAPLFACQRDVLHTKFDRYSECEILLNESVTQNRAYTPLTVTFKSRQDGQARFGQACAVDASYQNACFSASVTPYGTAVSVPDVYCMTNDQVYEFAQSQHCYASQIDVRAILPQADDSDANLSPAGEAVASAISSMYIVVFDASMTKFDTTYLQLLFFAIYAPAWFSLAQALCGCVHAIYKRHKDAQIQEQQRQQTAKREETYMTSEYFSSYLLEVISKKSTDVQ